MTAHKDRRDFKRVPVSVMVHGDSTTTLPLMFTYDISLGGIALETTDSLQGVLADGLTMAMTFSLPFGSQFLRVDGEIAWIRNNVTNFDGSKVSMVGLKFIDPSPEVIAEIRQYMERTASAESTPEPQPSAATASPGGGATAMVVESQPLDEIQAEEEAVAIDKPATDGLSAELQEQLDFMMERAKALANKEPAANEMDERISMAIRTMTPNDRKALFSQAVAPAMRNAGLLLLKFTVESRMVENLVESGETASSDIDLAKLHADDKMLFHHVADESRKYTGQLYTQGNTNDAKIMDSLVSRCESTFKNITKALGNIAVEKKDVSDLFQGKPVKDYYELIGQELQELANNAFATDDEIPSVVIANHTLKPWEVRAFLGDDNYWSRDERAVVAGFAALCLKFRSETAQLQKLYDNDYHVIDELDGLNQEGRQLLHVLNKKAAPVGHKFASEQNLDKEEKLNVSIKLVRAAFANLTTLLDNARSAFQQISSEMSTSGPATFSRAQEEAKQKELVKEKPRKKTSKELKRRQIIITVLCLLGTALILAFQIPKLTNTAPSSYVNPKLQTIIPVTKMESWKGWLFARVDSSKWYAMSSRERNKNAEKFYEAVKKANFKKMQVTDESGENVIVTIKVGRETRLRIN